MTLNISNLELAGKHIVIAEDDLSSIRYYEALLKYSGADVKIFNSGKAFVDYSNQRNNIIDLVFIFYYLG